MGMGDAAELSTLTVIDAGFLGDEPDEVVIQGHHVDLAGEFRYPEAVDDVLGGQLDVDRSPDGNVHLIGCDNFLVGITELEPPAVADCFDFQDVALVSRGAALLFPDSDDGGDGDDGDDDGGDDGPSDFELGIAVYLLGDFLVALAVPDGRVDDGAFDDDEDKYRDPEDEEEQFALVTCDWPGIPESRLRVLWRARRDDESCGKCWHQERELKESRGDKPVLHLDAVLSCRFDGLYAVRAVRCSGLYVASLGGC